MGTPDASRGPTVGRKRSGGGNRKVERWAGERVSWGPPPAGSPRSCFRLSGTIRPSLGRGARPNEATTQRRHARLAHHRLVHRHSPVAVRHRGNRGDDLRRHDGREHHRARPDHRPRARSCLQGWRQSGHDLVGHAEADVQAAIEVIHPLPWSLAVVLLVVFATIALLVTDLFLAVIGILVLPGLAVINRYYTAKVEDPATKAQERIGDVSAVAHESIDGALMVKTLGRERAEVERLKERAMALRDERVRMGQLRAAFEPAFEAIPAIGIIVLIAVGSWRASTGAITVGTLVQFVSLFELLAFPLRLIGFVLSDVPRAVVGRERIQEVFGEKISLSPATERLPLPDEPAAISVRSVSFSYDRNRVLENLSFEVAPNESVALVGPTGSGKSTLAHLLVRLADPENGSVRLGGVDLRHLDPDALRRSASIVFQESFLFAWLRPRGSSANFRGDTTRSSESEG